MSNKCESCKVAKETLDNNRNRLKIPVSEFEEKQIEYAKICIECVHLTFPPTGKRLTYEEHRGMLALYPEFKSKDMYEAIE